ncbi:alpha-glucosidase [Flavobacteriaceae bacterium]|nr:alpha-glucosidase [Flavobacteriaceae bacterium]MDB0061337.1 alpha-glucosidase [bacterium]MDA9253808.1 alpha-glucosidase [Flavobacteriaceae bacterium]MDA9327673.1 alpha-glucosidase [Flavobacteriaceae bacterium]MDB4226420.1 alpha-glucosidase [Flavobacteriaceae bacterium]
MTKNSQQERNWWKEGVIYQIYPRSFKDTSGNGVGDLQGIIQKLDYIESLGVTMVWLNPIYESPNDDNGYDISDYRAIMKEFGTMADFDELLQGLHKRNIKLVMDVVVNHSSDEHQWFQQSRSSRDNPYRDYYHWWPAEKGKPNHRWSFFDENSDAWKYDKQTDAYYLHYFSQKQPDLNWENSKVRQEVYDIMKFWADKGVDGFRLDAFQYVSKDITFPPFPEGYDINIPNVIKYHGMGPHIHTYLKEMYEQVLSKYDVFAVSEGVGSTLEDAHNLVDEDRKELQMAYHFEATDMVTTLEKCTLAQFKESFTKWDRSFAEKGWISIYLSNHDQSRFVNRYGSDKPAFKDYSAKMLNTFILSMRGTPYTYYGDELGMTNIGFTKIEQYKDIAAINGYKKAATDGEDLDLHLKNLNLLSRDNGRTPMQWDDTNNAGFSSETPWLPVHENHTTVNVANQQNDHNSVLNHFRKMVALRKDNLLLVYGEYEIIQEEHPTIYAYSRTLDDEQMKILLNFSELTSKINLSNLVQIKEVLINNYNELLIDKNTITLQPYQAVVLKF